MNLGALKDQLLDQFKELGDKIQESSAYIELKEKFDSLPTQIQKLVAIGALILFGLFLISFPYSYFGSSQTLEGEFNDDRELIRDLLRASSTLKERSPLPSTSSTAAIESRVQQVISDMRLTGEQTGSMQVIPDAKTRLATGAVNQQAVSILVKTLNLRQLTEIMHRLQSQGNGIQPISMEIKRSAGQTHYFDLIVKVFQFSLNIQDSAEPSKASPPPSRANRRIRPGGNR